MKKWILTLSTLMLIISTSVMLVACSPEEYKEISNNIGDKMPQIEVANKITSEMTALEMYNAGLSNYYAAQYVGSYLSGDVITKVSGMTTIQGLEIRKARDNGVYYMDNYTATKKKILGVEISMMEETVIEPSGIKYRSTNDCSYNESGALIAKTWGGKTTYPSREALLAKKPNDPAKINMYVINSDTITEMTAPEYDKKTKQYTFNLTVDPTKGTTEYMPVVKDMLALNGFAGADVNFNRLTFEVTMWDNGLIRSIVSDEAYKIKASIISGSCSLNAKTNFTYATDDMPMSTLVRF